jgi:FAD-linked oxidoreductase
MRRWRNWGGTVSVRPNQLHQPTSIAALQDIVRSARGNQRIRMAGSGHSFTPIVPSNDIMLLPHDFANSESVSTVGSTVGIDTQRMVARVPAGMVLHHLNEYLAASGVALANMGDITAQTVAGSISTSTHGTGLRFTGLAGQVQGFGLVTADGEHLDCNATENAEVFQLGRVGLGCLGILTYVDMSIVPAFQLRAVEQARRLSDVLDNFDTIVAEADHFEFYWIPHTKWALTKHNTRTQEPPAPRSAWNKWWGKTVMENYAFGAVCMAGRLVPAAIPRLATALPSQGRQEFTEASHEVFATRRLVKFHEMEYSIPREHLVSALRQIVEMVEREKLRISFPVEVRVTGCDDVPLSTSYGRESAYIAVHMYKGMEYERYFRMVEAILAPMQSRPHWGKIHFQSAKTLEPSYDRFGEFLALRERLDPERRFVNEYVGRVLGL